MASNMASLRWAALCGALLALSVGLAGALDGSRISHDALSPVVAPEFDSVDMGAGERFVETTDQQKLAAEPKDGVDPYHGLCMDVPMGLCVGSPAMGGVRMFTGLQNAKGLVGYWKFDEIGAQDSSGQLNSIVPAPDAGPGYLGGGSGEFDGTTPSKSEIQHVPAYNGHTLTVQFWIYLIHEPFGNPRSVFHKGRKNGDTLVSAPAIRIMPESRGLMVSISTDETHKTDTVSKFPVPLRRWTHITVSIDDRLVQIYMNGVLDSEFLIPAPMMETRDPIQLGHDPAIAAGPAMLLDELKIYNRALAAGEIGITGAAAFPGWNPRDVRPGCQGCSYQTAATKSCPEYFHLCSETELMAGALNIARQMGWVSALNDPGTYVWKRGSPDTSSDSGFGVCCRAVATSA